MYEELLLQLLFDKAGVQTLVSDTDALPVTDAEVEALLGAIRDRLPANLRHDRLDTADTFTDGEVLADQSGADDVLIFTFSNPVDLIWVRSDNGDSRADPFGGIPTGTLGIICEDGVPNPMTIRTDTVRVYSPNGATVNMWGYRYL